MIRRAAAAVRPQGVIAFHEPVICVNPHALPAVDLAVQSERCLHAAFHALLPHADVGTRLVACFEEAGLPTPHLIWESIAGGPASIDQRICMPRSASVFARSRAAGYRQIDSWLQATMHLATPHLIWESIASGPASPVWR
jgi:hypothetical protein